jgi:hypothetical protein
MSILIDENTKVIVQGISGRIGQFHAEDMMKNGTNVVGGVTPGKGGQTMLGVPVFNTMKGPFRRPVRPPRSCSCRRRLLLMQSWKLPMRAYGIACV